MPAPFSSHRPSAWEWARTAVVAVNFAWTALCLGGYRAETMVVTSALTGVMLAVYFAGRAVGRGPAPRAHAAGWLFLPFLLYAAANVIWVTPVRWLGWRDWYGWGQMIAVFWVVLNGVRAPAARRALLLVLAAIGVIAVLLACFQRFVEPAWMMLGRVQSPYFVGRASGSFGIPNSLAALLLLLLPPACEVAWRQDLAREWRIAAGAGAALFGLGLILTVSRGAWLSIALVVVMWPLVSGAGSWLRRLRIAGAALGGVVVVIGLLYALSPVVRDRLTRLVGDSGELARPVVWRAAWQLFREHPVTGTGAGSYNVLFEKYRPERFWTEPVWAHNDYLNTLSDYGAVGFGLFFGACLVVGWRCARIRGEIDPTTGAVTDGPLDSPRFTAAMAAGIAAFALQVFVDFHLKIPALAMALAIVGALVVQRRWPGERSATRRSPGVRAAFGLCGLACVGVIAWVFVPAYRAEALRGHARESIDQLAIKRADAARYRVDLPAARQELTQAALIDPENPRTWADLAYAISLATSAEPERLDDKAWLSALGRDAETAANNALARTSVVGEFYIRRGVARDLQGQWVEAGGDFSQAVTLSPALPVAWYYQAFHFYLDPRGKYLGEAALAFCLRLDPWNPDGLALRQRLAISAKPP